MGVFDSIFGRKQELTVSYGPSREDLLKEAVRWHEVAVTGEKDVEAREWRVLDARRKAGEILRQIKNGMNHGDWLPWLKTSKPGHVCERTLQRYMRFSETTRASDLETEKANWRAVNGRPEQSAPASATADSTPTAPTQATVNPPPAAVAASTQEEPPILTLHTEDAAEGQEEALPSKRRATDLAWVYKDVAMNLFCARPLSQEEVATALADALRQVQAGPELRLVA